MRKSLDFNPIFQLGDDLEQKILSPLSCIKEHESKWVLEFDLPLVDKKDINVYVDSNQTIIVEAKLRESYCDVHRKSYQYEYFKKSLLLPKNIDADNISAKFADGRLVIALPKTFQGKKIKIED
ncbi:MAG: Hsp20/alpha crystallin family protein [Candidatus Nitrosotenuis sp.]